ncbi:hypothetical protein SDC9_107165 [bioreactor metagenome]|uniref:Uncharacterized protein n=1 Tax=bioreactor metagenome TaxID=1076179 RepID=A0A645BF29_9ZZZZ
MKQLAGKGGQIARQPPLPRQQHMGVGPGENHRRLPSGIAGRKLRQNTQHLNLLAPGVVGGGHVRSHGFQP